MYGTTVKFKSANIFISAAQDQTAKFKDRQYFQLYGSQLQLPLQVVERVYCAWTHRELRTMKVLSK